MRIFSIALSKRVVPLFVVRIDALASRISIFSVLASTWEGALLQADKPRIRAEKVKTVASILKSFFFIKTSDKIIKL